jgi:hypothetical protein
LISCLLLQDIVALHKSHATTEEAAPSEWVDLSMDGVQENNTSGLSIVVVSLRFKNCCHVYPVVVYRPSIQRHDIDTVESLFWPVVQACVDLELIIDKIIADAPERANLRKQVNHNGFYGCDFCEEKGDNKLISVVRGVKWLPRPIGRLRTAERSRELAEKALILRESNGGDKGLKKDQIAETVGAKGYSRLHDLEGFDIIRDIPADYMHLICLGVYRRSFLHIFKVGF